MRCVERIGRPEFTLAEVYAFEDHLQRLFPDNSNVRPHSWRTAGPAREVAPDCRASGGR